MEVFYGVFTADWEQRRAALLHELSHRPRPTTEEEERRRRAVANTTQPVAGKGLSLRQYPGGANAGWESPTGTSASERPMAVRFSKLAAGGQPAVVKVASFGGGGRLKAMLNYISRQGAIGVETEGGQALYGSPQHAALARDWGPVLKNRSASRDIGTFEIRIQTEERRGMEELVRRLLMQALGDRSFAFAIAKEANGQVSIDGVTVLRSRSGERLSGDDKASEIVQRRLGEGRPANAVRFWFTGYGNGTDYGSRHVRALVRRFPGEVWNEDGRLIGGLASAGELVQREWRGQLHSRKSRDVMHLVLSARPGTDSSAFEKAGRAFLAAQFAGHRYAFSVHEPLSDPREESSGGRRPHVHLHAIVSMRSDSGDRITTTISMFRQWRSLMADKAQAYGIDMELTDRRDRASAPAYSRRSVRPTLTAGRTLHVGTSEAATLRYNDKRRDTVVFAGKSVEYRFAALRAWQGIELSLAGDGRRWVQEQIGRLMSYGPSHRRSGAERVDADRPRARQGSLHPKKVEVERAIRPVDHTDSRSVADAAREYRELRRALNDLLELRRKTVGRRNDRSAGEGNMDLRRSLQQASRGRQPDAKEAEQTLARHEAETSPDQDHRVLPQRTASRGGERAKQHRDGKSHHTRSKLGRETTQDDRET